MPGKAAIVEVSQVLATIGERSFQVEGHTDNVPIATAQYPSNWELAAGRALTVMKTMIESGMRRHASAPPATATSGP
jgi:chemotaxis protein MotB